MEIFSFEKRSNKKIRSNVKLMDRVEYRNVSKILSKYHVALMPYGNKIAGRSNNLEISKYISPLKMFDYLSSGNIIIASKLKAYNHILKNNFNSYLVDIRKIKSWANLIKKILANPKKYRKIKLEAAKTAKKYSWKNRAKQLIKFSFQILKIFNNFFSSYHHLTDELLSLVSNLKFSRFRVFTSQMIYFRGLKYFSSTSIIILFDGDKALSFNPFPTHFNFKLSLEAVKFTNSLMLYCFPVAIT